MSSSLNSGYSAVEGSMRAIADHITGNRGTKIVWGKEGKVCADVVKKILYIPKAAAGNNISQAALDNLRGRVSHEAAHISQMSSSKSDGLLGNIENALEDVRIEKAESRKHAGAGSIFYNHKVQCVNEIKSKYADKPEMAEKAPLMQAMCRCIFNMDGVYPDFPATEKTSEYEAKIMKYFQKAPEATSSAAIKLLAKQMLDELALPPEEEEEKESEGEDKDDQKGDEGQGGSSEGKGKSSKSSEKEGKEDSKGDKSEKKDKGSESGKGEKSENDGDGSEEGSGEGESDGDDKSEGGNESGDEGGDSDSDTGSDDSGDSNSENVESKEGNGEGQGKAKDANGKPKDKEGKDSQGKSGKAAGGKGASEAEKADIMKQLEKDADGDSIDNYMDQKLERDLTGHCSDYTTDRSKDQFAAPNISDEMRKKYSERRAGANASVTALTQAFTTAMRARAMAHKLSNQRRGKLDMRNIFKVATEGNSEDVFFKMRDGEKINTAVSILIDESGSMRYIINKVVDITMILAEALDAVKIPFSMIGHSTLDEDYSDHEVFDRFNPMILPVYKMFNEAWGNIKARLMNAQARNNNIDAEALAYTCEMVLTRKEARKIVFVFSDGGPAANCSGKEDLLAAALKSNVEKYRKMGVEIYNICLSTTEPHQYFGSKYCIDLVPGSDDFGSKLASAFTNVIMGQKKKV